MGSMRKLFRQGDIWRILKANPGAERKLLAERLQYGNLGAISRVLSRMLLAGCVRREGTTRFPRWYAIGKSPEDFRGLPIVSQQNLVAAQQNYHAALRLANIAKGLDPDTMGGPRKNKAQKRFTGALEACWLFPFSRTIN